MPNLTMHIYNEETGERDRYTVPGQWVICDACGGDGGTSAHLGAFTAGDWRELDEEWKNDYLRGAFDKNCEECRGTGKIVTYLDGPGHYTEREMSLILRHMEQEAEAAAEAYWDRETRRAESGYAW